MPIGGHRLEYYWTYLEKLVFGREVQKNPTEIGKSDPVFQFWAKYRTMTGVQTRSNSDILPLRGGVKRTRKLPGLVWTPEKKRKKGVPQAPTGPCENIPPASRLRLKLAVSVFPDTEFRRYPQSTIRQISHAGCNACSGCLVVAVCLTLIGLWTEAPGWETFTTGFVVKPSSKGIG